MGNDSRRNSGPAIRSWWSAVGWSSLTGAAGGAFAGGVLATTATIAESPASLFSPFWVFAVLVFGGALLVVGSAAGLLAAPAMKLLARSSRRIAVTLYSLVLSLLFAALYGGATGGLAASVYGTGAWAYVLTAASVALVAAGMSAATVFRRQKPDLD